MASDGKGVRESGYWWMIERRISARMPARVCYLEGL